MALTVLAPSGYVLVCLVCFHGQYLWYEDFVTVLRLLARLKSDAGCYLPPVNLGLIDVFDNMTEYWNDFALHHIRNWSAGRHFV